MPEHDEKQPDECDRDSDDDRPTRDGCGLADPIDQPTGPEVLVVAYALHMSELLDQLGHSRRADEDRRDADERLKSPFRPKPAFRVVGF